MICLGINQLETIANRRRLKRINRACCLTVTMLALGIGWFRSQRWKRLLVYLNILEEKKERLIKKLFVVFLFFLQDWSICTRRGFFTVTSNQGTFWSTATVCSKCVHSLPSKFLLSRLFPSPYPTRTHSLTFWEAPSLGSNRIRLFVSSVIGSRPSLPAAGPAGDDGIAQWVRLGDLWCDWRNMWLMTSILNLM